MTAMKKQVDFSVRPRAAKEEMPAHPGDWVREGKEAVEGPQKRLTLNLPAELHTAFKSHCVLEGVTIQDKVRALVEREVAWSEGPLGGGEPAKARP